MSIIDTFYSCWFITSILRSAAHALDTSILFDSFTEARRERMSGNKSVRSIVFAQITEEHSHNYNARPRPERPLARYKLTLSALSLPRRLRTDISFALKTVIFLPVLLVTWKKLWRTLYGSVVFTQIFEDVPCTSCFRPSLEDSRLGKLVQAKQYYNLLGIKDMPIFYTYKDVF